MQFFVSYWKSSMFYLDRDLNFRKQRHFSKLTLGYIAKS